MAAGSARFFSPTAMFARIAAPFERLHGRLDSGDPPLYSNLPEDARADLSRLLAPAAERLEALRLETVAQVDAAARKAMPAAAVAGFGLIYLAGQGLAAALLFGTCLAVAAFWLAQLRPAARYLTVARQAFGREVAVYLSDLGYASHAGPDLRRISRWKLFANVADPVMDDYMSGSRDGRRVALYRIGLTYREGHRKTGTAWRFAALCAEVETGPGCSGAVVLVPRWADPALRNGPTGSHGLREVQACDGLIEPFYEVFADSPADCGSLLNPDRCARIRKLAESCAALDAGSAPVLVFLPGYLAALYPAQAGTALFTPPPFWRPLEPEATLARLASELAVKHALLMETLELGPEGAVAETRL